MASFSTSYGGYAKKTTSPLIEQIAQSENGFTLPKTTNTSSGSTVSTATTSTPTNINADTSAVVKGLSAGANPAALQSSLSTPSALTTTALLSGATPAAYAVNNGNAETVDSGSNTNGGNTNNSNGVSAYQSYYDSILADQRAAMEARQKALEDNYNRQLGVLQNAHNENVNNLDSQRDDALRSAYISYMLGQKGLNQQLSNQGMNGGAVESTLAKLLNNYGGNRGSIENQYAQALGNLNSAYDSNVATLAGQYGNNIADVLADYYNNAASAKQNYANQLMSLAKANASASAKNTTNIASTANTDSTPSLAQNTIGSNINVGNVSNYNRQNAINDLKYMRGQETDKEALDTVVNTYLNTLMDRYGISEAEAMGILEEANIY